MLIKVNQYIENEIWKLDFINVPEKISETDKILMRQYGEPEIAIGGSFGTSPDVYTLPAKYIKLRSGFPFTQEFDSTCAPFNTDTQTKVLAFRDTVITNVTSALTTLRDNEDTFTSEQVYNL